MIEDGDGHRSISKRCVSLAEVAAAHELLGRRPRCAAKLVLDCCGLDWLFSTVTSAADHGLCGSLRSFGARAEKAIAVESSPGLIVMVSTG